MEVQKNKMEQARSRKERKKKVKGRSRTGGLIR